MRILLNDLDGHTGESVETIGDEISRMEVFAPTGYYVGTVVYVKRRYKDRGTLYGWRPAQTRRVKLTSKADAIKRLPRYV